MGAGACLGGEGRDWGRRNKVRVGAPRETGRVTAGGVGSLRGRGRGSGGGVGLVQCVYTHAHTRVSPTTDTQGDVHGGSTRCLSPHPTHLQKESTRI